MSHSVSELDTVLSNIGENFIQLSTKWTFPDLYNYHIQALYVYHNRPYMYIIIGPI